jgi:hypothetical protein
MLMSIFLMRCILLFEGKVRNDNILGSVKPYFRNEISRTFSIWKKVMSPKQVMK